MIISVDLRLHECSAVSKRVGAGARDVLRIFRSLGGEYLRYKRGSIEGQVVTEIDPTPESNIDTTSPNLLGSFANVYFSHKTLQRSEDIFATSEEEESRGKFPPVGEL